MDRFYTRRNINIGIAVFLLLLGVFGWYTFVNMNRARQETRTVNASLQSLRSFEDIMDDMQDLETGQRGYLISGKKEFLAPYYSALSKLRQDTLSFKNIFPLHPERITAFRQLLLLVKRKVELTTGSIEGMNDPNLDSIIRVVKTGSGKKVMDSIRHLIASFENEDRLLLYSSNRGRQVAATNTAWLFVVSAVIFLITLGLLFWGIKKELKYREGNEKQLAHLASLIDQTSDAVFSTDISLVIKSWNRAAEEMYGYTAAEATGRQAGELLQIRGGKEDDKKTMDDLRRQGYYKGDYAATTNSGNTVFIQVSMSVLRNDKYEIDGYVAIHRDITERIKTEELLGKFNEELNRQVQEKTDEIKHSNERFEMITRTTNDAIWEWNFETGRMWANETHQQLYGITLADPVPDEKQWEERIHPDDRQATVNGLQAALSADTNVWISEYRFRAGDAYKYIYDRSYIVRNGAGKPTRILGSMMDVTERRNAELSIQESESRFRAFFENSMDGILLTAPDGKILAANSAACKMFGMTEQQICLAGRDGIVDTNDARFPALLKERKQTGKARGELTCIRNDGTKFPADISSSVFLDISGEERTSMIIRDITERKTAEESIRTSEEIRKLIMNSSLDGIVCIDPDGNITVWTPQAEKIFGWKEQEVLGKKLTETIIPEAYKERHEKGIRHYQQTGRGPLVNKLVEITAINKMGNEFPVELSIIPIKQGNIEFFCGFIRDITERKKAEEQIVKEKELSDTAINSLPGIFYMFDGNRKFLRWNKNFERVSGYTAEEIPGIEPVNFFAEEDRVLALQKVQETFKNGSAQLEAHFLTKNGDKIPYFFTGLSVNYGGVSCMLGTGIDIRERKIAEAALKASEEKLRHVLISSAHDFYVIDTNYRVILINEKARENLLENWGSVVTIGTHILEAAPPGKRQYLKENYEKAFSGERIEYERLNNPRGKPSWVQVGYMPVTNETGAVTGVYVVTKDITQRKIAEEELRQSNNRFEMITRTTHDAVWEWDLLSGQLWSNETHQLLYGLTVADPVPAEGMWIQRIHPDDRKEIVEKQQAALASGTNVFISEYRFLGRENQYINLYDRCYIVRDETGKPVRMMGSMMDITERKKAEEAVRISGEQYRALVENAPEALVVMDMEQGKFVSVSESAVKLFKMPREKLLQLGPLDLSPEFQPGGKLSAEAAPEYLKEAMEGGKPAFEWVHKNNEGKEIPCEVRLVRLPSDKQVLIRGSIIDISERKKAEEEIVKTNARFQIISKATSDIVWDWNLVDDSLWWNDNYYANLGYRKQKEIVHIEDWYQRIHPEDVERVSNNVRKAIEGRGSSWQDAYRYLKFDGTYLHFLDRGFILRDPEGKAYKIIGSMVDMSPVYEAQKKISESEEKYRTLVEQAIDAIALYDASGKILDVNTGSVSLLEYTKEELMQMSLADILTEEEIKVKPVRYDVLEQGESTVKQRSMRKKGGSVVQTEVRSQQLPDGRFLSVIRDLTERVKAQELIEKEKELSDKLIDSLPGIFYWYDENGHFLRWNRQLELVSGYTGKEVAEMHPTQFFEGEGKKYIIEKIKGVFRDGTADAEAEFVSKDGSRHPYYFKAIRISIDGHPSLLGTGIDISDRKKAEQELETSYDAVRKLTEYLQNVREEERTHMAREIHDELGQQLTVLKMDVSWLNKKIMPADDAIRQKMKDLLLMLDETVRTVRRISSELRPSLLDDLGLTAALEWQLKEFEKRSGIKTKFEAPEKEIKLSNNVKTALFRIFQESLTNVARHSGASNLAVSLGFRDNQFILSIIDDGKGFDLQTLEEKRTLGILGMKERTSMIGGDYKITSRPGAGTTVEVAISHRDAVIH